MHLPATSPRAAAAVVLHNTIAVVVLLRTVAVVALLHIVAVAMLLHIVAAAAAAAAWHRRGTKADLSQQHRRRSYRGVDKGGSRRAADRKQGCGGCDRHHHPESPRIFVVVVVALVFPRRI